MYLPNIYTHPPFHYKSKYTECEIVLHVDPFSYSLTHNTAVLTENNILLCYGSITMQLYPVQVQYLR